MQKPLKKSKKRGKLVSKGSNDGPDTLGEEPAPEASNGLDTGTTVKASKGPNASKGSNEGIANEAPKTKLPGICLTILNDHECQCAQCDPNFERKVETRMIRKIYRDNSAALVDDTKNRIAQNVASQHQARIEQKMVAKLEIAIPKKVQNRLTAYEVKLRVRKFEEVVKEWKANLIISYRVKVQKEIRNEFYQKLKMPTPVVTTSAISDPSTISATTSTITATAGSSATAKIDDEEEMEAA